MQHQKLQGISLMELFKASIVEEVKRELMQILQVSVPAANVDRPRRNRRSWTPEQKQKIVAEALAVQGVWGGVKKVCEKHQITPAQLTQWKRQAQ
jgi:hypothetical protein